MQRRYKTVVLGTTIAAFFAAALASAPSASAQTFLCAQDLNNDGDVAQQGETASCVSTPQGELCPISQTDCVSSVTTTSPTCPAGSTLDAATGRCEAPATCPAGYTLSAAGCTAPTVYKAASCPSPSTLNTNLEQCTYSGNNISCSCQAGYTVLDCTPIGKILGWTIYAVTCGTAPVCPAGYTYDKTLDQCAYTPPPASPTCVTGTAFNTATLVCDASPTCISGTYDPSIHLCSSSTYTCPLGSQYACMASNNTYSCSPNTCVDTGTAAPSTTTADLTAYTNNGTIDPNTGSCLGQIYIFNGKGEQCRPAGVQTSYFDCCSNGSGGTLGFMKNCQQGEATTDAAVAAGRCHSIGLYYVESWPLIGCVQRAYVYCCFNSLLGRIIQEQGRPQLKDFQPGGNWGTPTAPNCIGFTPDEFQMIDFSKVDLSEFTSTIETNMVPQIQQQMNNAVNQFFNNTQ